jgi:predicted GH43/DUF377 family glycosyl hydrolase/tetratricopeptide (TPR) repeat protein
MTETIEHPTTAAWDPLFQTTVDAYYAGDLAAGRAAVERLLALPDLPPGVETRAHQNLIFYAPTLGEACPSFQARPIEIPVPEGWSRYNPSVAAGPDGLAMIVRSGNYTMTPRLEYAVHGADSVVRTTNYLVALDTDLALHDVHRIDDAAFRPEPPPFPVAGFEDCRLVWHRGGWWASATTRDRGPSGICQIALLRLEDATVREMRLLSDGVSRHEKNWMPVAGDAETLRFVYAPSPTVLLRYDDATGTVASELTREAPPIARHFSGGTQLIPIEGGHLALIHDGVRFEEGWRVYVHRWVWFDPDWRLARVSAPFIFQERGVEFAAGLAQHGDDLVISYGVWDREAWLATVSLAEVLSLLAPADDPAAVAAAMAVPVAAVPEPAPEPAQASIAEPSAPADGITLAVPAAPVIVSTTLSGNSRDIIGDALASVVDAVDWVLVIDTGITDDTLEIAHAIAGDKLVVRPFPWRDDFSAARNFALEAAHALGADWALTVDTDERLALCEVDQRAALAASPADSLHVKHVNGVYGKERIFRLPVRGRYAGPTHEAFLREGETGTLAGVTFDELGKTFAQYQQKAERDIAILTRHTAENPHDPRWFYYLGDSFAGLGRHDEAIAAFRVCASLNGWDEEGAWAMYRAAESFLKTDRPAEAVAACAAGMARHAGLAELPWLAGYASWQAGRPDQAAYWARQAIAMGHFAGAGPAVPRLGFRHPPALWEGPYDVLRYALRALGDDAGADEAERLFHEAWSARQRGGG